MNAYKTVLLELLKNKWLPFIFGLPLFFCSQHYEGIGIDSKLYLLQVVHSWFPDRFVNDVSFMYGNQDSYGVYTVFYAPIIKFFGAEFGAKFFCLLTHFLWCLASIFLIKSICDRFNKAFLFFPVMIVFTILNTDGVELFKTGFFPFVEDYTCSRMLSLVFGMMGLAFVFKEKKIVSVVFFLLGTLIHPITSGWGVPVWLFYFFPKLRGPVVIASMFVPLTFLLHKGPFDFYSREWGSFAYGHDITYRMVIREILACVFFGLVVKKCTIDETLKNISRCVFLVLFIGLYWTVAGGVPKHIFLYQVQTWRIEWIFWALMVPIYFLIFVDKVKKIRSENNLKSYDLGFFLTGLVLFIPNYDFVLVLITAFIFLKKNKECSYIGCCYSCLLFAAYVFIFNYLAENEIGEFTSVWCLIYGFSDAYANLYYLTLVEIVLTFFLISFRVKKKGVDVCGVLASLLLLFVCVKPQFIVAPLLVVVLLLPRFKLKIGAVIFLTILLLIDGIGASPIRTEDAFKCLKVVFGRTYLFILAVLIFFFLFSLKPVSRICSNQIKRCIFALLFSLPLWGYAVENYDTRTKEKIEAEKEIDSFVDETIFPQIKNRGKMFFYVDNDLVSYPRLQFLTGGYFDELSHIGEPLFEKQFYAARLRDNYIVYKENRNSVVGRGTYKDFAERKFHDPDTLLDRTVFLCEINEITHLVTSTPNMSLPLLDSTELRCGQKVFLYGCRNED